MKRPYVITWSVPSVVKILLRCPVSHLDLRYRGPLVLPGRGFAKEKKKNLIIIRREDPLEHFFLLITITVQTRESNFQR